ncbi:MAG: flavodoxin family protein, partial [Spirochaetia bacterium]|nr:flavodoxin family protein [Spirochaetia bacterium]
MKQCIVYYSKTGNTESVAKKFKDFDLLQVKANSDDLNIQNPTLTVIPEIKGYEYVVFATPVHGFQISKVMKTYLETITDYKDAIIDLYITHFFPFAWMGGNSSLNQMKKIIES